jgi:hypothetical protein
MGSTGIDLSAGMVPRQQQPQQGEVDLSAGLLPKSQADEASETRQMLVSGLTGMPTPNMTAADRTSFAQGKAAGAVSVPLVAAGVTGGAATAEFGPQVIKAVQAAAEAHPIVAKALAYGLAQVGAGGVLHKLGWLGKALEK